MDATKAEQHILRSLQLALSNKKVNIYNINCKSKITKLIQKQKGNSKDYEKIMKALEASPTSTLVFWFRALVKCISLVDPQCIELITLLLRYSYDGGQNANGAFEK